MISGRPRQLFWLIANNGGTTSTSPASGSAAPQSCGIFAATRPRWAPKGLTLGACSIFCGSGAAGAEPPPQPPSLPPLCSTSLCRVLCFGLSAMCPVFLPHCVLASGRVVFCVLAPQRGCVLCHGHCPLAVHRAGGGLHKLPKMAVCERTRL